MKFDGVGKIASFNRHQYAAGLATIGLAQLVESRVSNPLFKAACRTAQTTAVYLTASSLVASWYVYDHSDLYEWKWLVDALPIKPKQWVNVHEGFDEAGRRMAGVIGAPAYSLDVSSGLTKLTPSIKRARRLNGIEATAAVPAKLPLADGSSDSVFALFSAHEVRNPSERQKLLSELARVAGPTGQVVLVEHIRDGRNALVFGHGAFHFFACDLWLRQASGVGLELVNEIQKTPFVRAWIFRPQALVA